MNVESISSVGSVSSTSVGGVSLSQVQTPQAAPVTLQPATTSNTQEAIQSLQLNSLIYTPDTTAPGNRLTQDYQALQTALQLGDLVTAQQAFIRLRFDYLGSSLTQSGQSLNLLA
jgi:hypothetical protein